MGRIYKRGEMYGLDYNDQHGRRVRKLVARDRTVAVTMLANAMKTVERLRAGIISSDPKEGKKPIQQHFDAYAAELKRRGRDQMYIYIVRRHLELAAEAMGWACLAECTTQSVTQRLQKLEGLSAKTVNAHRADLAAFFGWCKRTGRMETCPTDHIAKSADRAEKTRRALSVAEIRALLKAAPRDRQIVYLFLVCTGLRRAEAGQIRWGHLHLDALNPYVELPASLTKSGRPESVPLVDDLAEALRDHRGDADDGDLVFREIPSMVDFRADLAAAHIEEQDSRGRKVVLHSLRHSLCTMLAASKVPQAIAQRLMRHRDPRLTAEHYTDEGLLPLHDAVAALPKLIITTIPPAAAEARQA